MEELLIRHFDISFIDISAYVGLAAAGVMTANLFVGLLLSIQYSPAANWPHRRIPLFGIHKWTGYGALFLALLHPAWLPLANGANFTLLAVFYPLVTTEQPILTSLGTLSAYTLIFVVVTAYFRQRFEYAFWKKLHYASYVVIGLFLVHGVFTEPSLKHGATINFFDGGKLFIEACAVICVGLIAWRITLGRKLRRMNASHAVSLSAWHGQLTVAKIIDVAADVKVFRLIDPAGGPLPFHFLPGQYLSFRLAEGERIFTRSYSICSAPGQQDFCDIAVKRMEAGRGSVYLHERIAPGQLLTCIGPLGNFTFTGAEADSLVLIAGGIGITPLLSVLKHLAQSNWPHEVYLLFAVSTPADILFEQEIRAIAQRYRHFKYLILPSRVSGFPWEGPSGRIQADHLADFVPHIYRRRVHLCGPEPMMATTIAVLQALNVPDSQVHTELFGDGNVVAIDGLAGATVTFATSAKTCFAPPGMTLLDAAEECGVVIESLCRAGTCGTCKVKVLAGEAIMQRDDALTTRDIRHRIVLACQARATTADIRLEC